MAETENSNLMQSLLEQNPEQVQKWLKLIFTEQQSYPKNFNWLGFAEVSSLKATKFAKKAHKSAQFRSLSLNWANIALSIYEFLIQKNLKGAESYYDSLMHLRLFMILKFGTSDRDRILDPKNIIQWAFNDLDISPEEALEKSSNWQQVLVETNNE